MTAWWKMLWLTVQQSVILLPLLAWSETMDSSSLQDLMFLNGVAKDSGLLRWNNMLCGAWIPVIQRIVACSFSRVNIKEEWTIYPPRWRYHITSKSLEQRHSITSQRTWISSVSFYHKLLFSFNRYPVSWCERVYSFEQHIHWSQFDYSLNCNNSRVSKM